MCFRVGLFFSARKCICVSFSFCIGLLKLCVCCWSFHDNVHFSLSKCDLKDVLCSDVWESAVAFYQPSRIEGICDAHLSSATLTFVKKELKQNKRLHKVSFILQDATYLSHSEAPNRSHHCPPPLIVIVRAWGRQSCVWLSGAPPVPPSPLPHPLHLKAGGPYLCLDHASSLVSQVLQGSGNINLFSTCNRAKIGASSKRPE